jgi:hypothetical protein
MGKDLKIFLLPLLILRFPLNRGGLRGSLLFILKLFLRIKKNYKKLEVYE